MLAISLFLTVGVSTSVRSRVEEQRELPNDSREGLGGADEAMVEDMMYDGRGR